MNIDTSLNNFARGKIDHDMNARYDLPVFQTGADIVENFITNFKGNAIFRAGFEAIEKFEDCVMIEFKFNKEQQYLCLFYANKIRFMSYDSNNNFGYVLDGGSNILEVATPYTLAQCRLIQFSQNDDDMIVTVKGVEPYKLNRASANSFTFKTYARKFDPFPLTYGSTVNVSAVTQATNALVTTAAHGLTTGDRVKFLSVTGMTQLNDWVATVTVTSSTQFTIDVDTTTFTAYSSGGTIQKVLTGDYPKCCLFYKARLYYGVSVNKITTLWASVQGQYYDHTATPVTVTTALTFTIAEISQEIEWLFPGDNSLIVGASDGIVAVNGGGVNQAITAENIEATLTSAEPCNGAYPLKKDGLIFYLGVDGRNMYYFQYDILKEAFQGADANFLSYDITAGKMSKIRYKKDRNNLIVSTTESEGKHLLTCNFKQEENIIGWHEHPTSGEFIDIAVITDNFGKPQLFSLVLRNGEYFIERQGPYVEFKQRTKFFTGKNEEAKRADNEAYNRYVAEQLKLCIFVDNAVMFNNLKSTQITFDGVDTITAAAPTFSSPGDVGKHIVYKTMTGYESGRFLITAVNSTTEVEVEILQTPTQNVYSDWYLTFSSISGLSDYEGFTVSVVADGGYLDDFEVVGGTINFERQITHMCLGYKYKGIVKSFSLGFQIQTVNTQDTLKGIAGFGVRCVATSGLEVGSSPYKTEPVQELSQNDINYLPPIPIDGTKNIPFSDDTEIDKCAYIIQDQPLPATVTGLILTTAYGAQR